MNRTVASIWLILASLVLGMVIMYHLGIPRCPEDSVLVGIGYFQWGRWTSYECGPAFDDVGD